MGIYNPFGGNNAGGWLQNLFKPKTKSTQQPVTFGNNAGGANPFAQTQQTNAVSGYGYNPYQIKTGDTFENIAQQNNTTVDALQQANDGMLIPPPKGSMINIPQAAQTSPVYQTIQQQGVNPATPAYVSNSFVSPTGQYNLDELNGVIQQQIAAGQLPSTVSFYTPIINPTTGQPVSDAEMQANGYTYDTQKKEWKLGTAGQTNAGGGGNAGGGEFANTKFMQEYAAKGTSFVNQKRWDPDRKKFVSIGQLLKEGKLSLSGQWRGARQRNRRKARQATNAGTLPGTTLNTNLGGG